MSTKLRTIKTHCEGDLLLRFALEVDSRDSELIKKFGEPEIEVGGTYFSAATLSAPVINGGAISSVAVSAAGGPYTYSAQRPIVFQTSGTSGSEATFAAVLTNDGRLSSVTVTAGGSNYSQDTIVRITSGDHVTAFPAQKVKLVSGFPYTRRINSIDAGDTSLDALADLYVAQIQTNVGTALTGIRALDNPASDLTEEIVYQP